MPVLTNETCAAFLEQMRGLMTSWAIGAGARPQDADDLVQETIIQAMQNGDFLATLEDKRRAAWLKQTVRNKVIDAHRYRSRDKRSEGRTRSLTDLAADAAADRAPRHRRGPSEPVARDTTPLTRASLAELRARALSRLPEDQQSVCTLFLEEKLTPDEIAARLGIPLAGVQITLARGMARLKTVLKQLGVSHVRTARRPDA